MLLIAGGLLVAGIRMIAAIGVAGRFVYESDSAAEYLCADVDAGDGSDTSPYARCVDRWLELGPQGALFDGLVQALAWALGLAIPGATLLLTAEGRARPAADRPSRPGECARCRSGCDFTRWPARTF